MVRIKINFQVSLKIEFGAEFYHHKIFINVLVAVKIKIKWLVLKNKHMFRTLQHLM